MEDDIEWDTVSTTQAPSTNVTATSPANILDLEGFHTPGADALLTFSENDLQLVNLPPLLVNQSPLDPKEERKEDDFSIVQPLTKKTKITQQRKFEETPEESKLRFLMELEFVQCLANPQYLHCMSRMKP
jgi:hypothetical protein